MENTLDRKNAIFLLLMMLAAVIPWLWVQMNVALNTNHSWLTIAAARLIDGGTMVGDVYETNPPLSILLYFPVVFLHRIFAVPVEYAPYVFGLIGLALTTSAVWWLLKKWPGLDAHRHSVLVAAYFIGGAIMPSNLYFGERDEFVMWGLMPFAIAQILITDNMTLNKRIAFPVLFLSSLCIFIKPHYVLFPCLLFLHRLIMRRNLWFVVKDIDCQAIIAAGAFYAAILAIFFMDYMTQILPEFIKYYLNYENTDVWNLFIQNVQAILVVFFVSFLPDFQKGDRKIISLLLAGGIISFLLFYIQGKGFEYQLIPARIFTFCAAIYLIDCMMRGYLKPIASRYFMVVVMALIAYNAMPLKLNFPTHQEYAQLPLPKLAQSCAPDCSFFIFSENMEMIWQASIYSGAELASRFPCPWWLHYMLREGIENETRFRYTRYMAQDLGRYKPKILAIANNLKFGKGDNFDFVKFFSAEPSFAAEMKHYRKTRELKDNRGDYYTGTNLEFSVPINYDIYERID